MYVCEGRGKVFRIEVKIAYTGVGYGLCVFMLSHLKGKECYRFFVYCFVTKGETIKNVRFFVDLLKCPAL